MRTLLSILLLSISSFSLAAEFSKNRGHQVLPFFRVYYPGPSFYLPKVAIKKQYEVKVSCSTLDQDFILDSKFEVPKPIKSKQMDSPFFRYEIIRGTQKLTVDYELKNVKNFFKRGKRWKNPYYKLVGKPLKKKVCTNRRTGHRKVGFIQKAEVYPGSPNSYQVTLKCLYRDQPKTKLKLGLSPVWINPIFEGPRPILLNH